MWIAALRLHVLARCGRLLAADPTIGAAAHFGDTATVRGGGQCDAGPRRGQWMVQHPWGHCTQVFSSLGSQRHLAVPGIASDSGMSV